MMNIDILKHEARGQFDFGWLKTSHSFSFGHYYNPERLKFGKLIVVNDDWVEPGQGFDTHPHRNMEIISIPLEGALSHKDTLGNVHTIRAGEVQVMSAGTGVAHSEYNHSKKEPVNFLQIWIEPDQLNLEPSYQQKEILAKKDQWQTLVSKDGVDGSLRLHQDAQLSIIESSQETVSYKIMDQMHGLFIFVLEGQASINDKALYKRDAVMLTHFNTTEIEISLLETSKILVIEVPQ